MKCWILLIWSSIFICNLMIAQSDSYVYYGIGDLESHSRKLKVKREMESMKNSINPAPKYQASIPIGWSSIGADDEEQLYILGHQTLPGMIFLLPSASNNAKEIIQEINSEMQSAGIIIHECRNFERFGKFGICGITTGNYSGTDIKAYFIIIPSPKGGTVISLVLSHTNMFTKEHKESANLLANSIKF